MYIVGIPSHFRLFRYKFITGNGYSFQFRGNLRMLHTEQRHNWTVVVGNMHALCNKSI